MDQGSPDRIPIYETVVLFGSTPSVGQRTPEDPQYLHFYSRYLIESVPPSEKKLWYLHTTYGASLKSLFIFAGQPDMYRAVVIDEIDKLSVEGFARLLHSAGNASDNSYYLMSTGPMPTDRTKPEWKVASPHIVEECFRQAVHGYENEATLTRILGHKPVRPTTRMALTYLWTGSVRGNVSSPAESINSQSTNGCSSSQTSNNPPPPSRFGLHSTWKSMTQKEATWRMWSKFPGMPRGTWLFSRGGETKDNGAEELSKE